jgi:hypothetical protein
MTTAAANEYKSQIGPDFTLADAFDEEYMDEAEEARDPRRDEDAAPLFVRRPKVERCGAFFI